MNYNNLVALVDADVAVYRCGFAADSQVCAVYKQNVNPDADKEELKAHKDSYDYLVHALGNTKALMEELSSVFNKDTMRVFLSGSGNFREQVATILPYKGNRDPTHKPKYYEQIKRYLIDYWKAEVIDGQEADDALAQTQWAATDDSTVIVTIDKDLDMIPGNHYNFVKKEFYYVDQLSADLNFYRQMLIGDRTDNIPGINQIGEAKADKIIKGCYGELDILRDKVIELYKKQYGAEWHDAYQEVGVLLWMRRNKTTASTLGEYINDVELL